MSERPTESVIRGVSDCDEFAHRKCAWAEDDKHLVRLQAIQEKLVHGVPPLSDADSLFLWYLATGETIVRRKRCGLCDGTGETYTNARNVGGHATPTGVVFKVDVETRPCIACKGEGYVQ